MFRRAVGSLLARRLSPRVIPRTAPARSFHSSLRDLTHGDMLDGAAVFSVAALAGAGGTLAVQYFKKGPDDDESAARRKEEDMKARFQDWMKKHKKSYQSEEEKAMRFQLFKATVDKFPRHPPQTLHYYADWTDQERRKLRAYPDGIAHDEEFKKYAMDLLAKYEKGEPLMIRPDVKQGDKQATQVSA